MEADILLISDYLAGNLSEDARKQLEERLNQDETFAQLHAEQVRLLMVLRAGTRAKTKADLHQAFNTYRRTRQRSRRLWMTSAIAASLALLLLFWIRPWQKNPTVEQLAMGYLDPFPVEMDRGISNDSSLQVVQDSALLLYRKGEYAAAIPLFRGLLLQAPEDHALTMYLAESLSHTGQYAEAASLFEALRPSPLYGDAAEWRLALNRLLAGEREMAIVTLKKIGSSSHYKSKEAQELLESLASSP